MIIVSPLAQDCSSQFIGKGGLSLDELGAKKLAASY